MSAFQFAIASSSNQTVKSPRRRSPSLYSAQLRTWYFFCFACLYWLRLGYFMVEHTSATTRGAFRSQPERCNNAAFSEGLAEIGVELVFPSEERRNFEREVLFPLAGLATKDYEHYDAVRREAKTLRAAQTETARRYLDRELTGRQARDWLQQYALTADVESALRFVTIYRSHVASYEVGERMMRDYLESRAEGSEKWDAFEQMLTAGGLFLDNEHPQ